MSQFNEKYEQDWSGGVDVTQGKTQLFVLVTCCWSLVMDHDYSLVFDAFLISNLWTWFTSELPQVDVHQIFNSNGGKDNNSHDPTLRHNIIDL